MPRFPQTPVSRVALVSLGLLAAAVATHAEDPVVRGAMYARISVTVDPDEGGTILVPSPFAVIPLSNRVVIRVPESGGIFLLEGERILHHYPLPDEDVELHDMAATERLFVAGRHDGPGFVTADLRVFDLRTGETVASIQSKNPHLHVELEHEETWRVLIEHSRVGIFHPEFGASYPLWEAETGVIPGPDQMAQASSGIGFGGDTRWTPEADGTVTVRNRGRSSKFVGADRGEFLDSVLDRAVLLMRPRATVRADADGDFLLSRNIGVRLVGENGVEKDFRLRSMSRDVRASRLVIQGRPIRVHGDRIYWLYLGPDFLEIRTVPVSAIPGSPLGDPVATPGG